MSNIILTEAELREFNKQWIVETDDGTKCFIMENPDSVPREAVQAVFKLIRMTMRCANKDVPASRVPVKLLLHENAKITVMFGPNDLLVSCLSVVDANTTLYRLDGFLRPQLVLVFELTDTGQRRWKTQRKYVEVAILLKISNTT